MVFHSVKLLRFLTKNKIHFNIFLKIDKLKY